MSEWVGRFEGESREVFALRHELVEAIGLQPGQAIADIGAGTGAYLGPLSAAVGRDGTVYAVDISPRFLEHLARRAETEGLGNVEVVRGTEQSVELPEASLDAAWICDTYHHFEHHEQTLASLHRALKPGGTLVVVDFHRVEGESPEWILKHVRAGQDVFAAEIEAAGFMPDGELPAVGLEQNYALRFRRN